MTEINIEEVLKKCDEKWLFYLKNAIIKELKRRLEKQE